MSIRLITYKLNPNSATVSLAYEYRRTPHFEHPLTEGDIVSLHRHHGFFDTYLVVDRLKLDITKDIAPSLEAWYPGQLCLLDISCYN